MEQHDLCKISSAQTNGEIVEQRPKSEKSDSRVNIWELVQSSRPVFPLNKRCFDDS